MKREVGLGTILAAIVLLILTFVEMFRSPSVRLVIRDLVVAEVAHLAAGDEVGFGVVVRSEGWQLGEQPVVDYSYSDYVGEVTGTSETWGIYTNSVWLSDFVRHLSSVIAEEKISEPRVPAMAVFVPFWARGIRLAGYTECADYTGKLPCSIFLNERLVLDEDRDYRVLIETVTHEMIHVQGGVFYNPSGDFMWQDRSAVLEAATSATTTEVLAAMCNYGDDRACRAFWKTIEDYARSALRNRIGDDTYRLLASVLWWDKDDERRAIKWDRLYAGREWERQVIREKYLIRPYECHILSYILSRQSLDTEIVGTTVVGNFVYTVTWDDTEALLGDFLVWWIRLWGKD